MALSVEISGKVVERFRAYAAARITRKPTGEDHYKRAIDGKPPLAAGSRLRYDAHQVAFEGDVIAATGATVMIPAGETAITHVVFYRGPASDEVVVGSLHDINATGDIAISLVLVEPEPAAEAEVIDE